VLRTFGNKNSKGLRTPAHKEESLPCVPFSVIEETNQELPQHPRDKVRQSKQSRQTNALKRLPAPREKVKNGEDYNPSLIRKTVDHPERH